MKSDCVAHLFKSFWWILIVWLSTCLLTLFSTVPQPTQHCHLCLHPISLSQQLSLPEPTIWFPAFYLLFKLYPLSWVSLDHPSLPFHHLRPSPPRFTRLVLLLQSTYVNLSWNRFTDVFQSPPPPERTEAASWPSLCLAQYFIHSCTPISASYHYPCHPT